MIPITLKMKKKNKQLTSNVGLYYACYGLSKNGWNVMPTARNVKGVDIVIYNQDATETRTIQVKSLSKRGTANFKNLIADYIIIITKVYRVPEIFIFNKQEITKRNSNHIQYSDYKVFEDNWKALIKKQPPH
jgi:hypothetical protein